MSESSIVFIIIYTIALTISCFLRKLTHKVAKEAIEKKCLNIGIYSLFPIKGEKAVEIANGYIKVSNIIFWFVAIFFPFVYLVKFLN
ncbi:hypothetical protein C2E25_07990 [Geothermobacter hydrogeniphilus]|uniref:Uncharacterized protein n=2 Tax=Geothermobacter hydrogeniphilus TaxID=1969733 RepID=A0A2K2HAL7_9BACT|nr:hypothetical protein C2E25_07990 [Geothermobacter hydrogeniphilus]